MQFHTRNDAVKGGGESMMITKVKIVVQTWGRVTIRVVERDIVVSMSKLNSDAGTI